MSPSLIDSKLEINVSKKEDVASIKRNGLKLNTILKNRSKEHQDLQNKIKLIDYKFLKEDEKPDEYKLELVWLNIIALSLLHLGSLYGLYLLLSGQITISTFIFGIIYGFWSSIGVTAGAHRLWTHKSYKAKLPLRLLLAISQTASFQNSIHEWVRDHRVHHKFCDTNADPHNSKRGFFFSHCGWLMCKKHQDVKEKGKTVDLSDIESDWIVMFQKKYYMLLFPIFCFVIPSLIASYLFGESGWVSFWTVGIFRYTFTINITWLVNSAAHIWGDKPYDKNSSSTENSFVGIFALGEGWHNYHHAFPWDYKTSELFRINFTTRFINLCSKIGWAYDLKEASPELIKRKIERNNQQERKKNPHEGELWGWDDIDMTKEEKDLAIIMAKKNYNISSNKIC